jgi:23S rRNA pseudouridine1911/1915/1917 synthase
MTVEILYLDNHLLAAMKPAGLVTQPSGHHADSLEDRAKAYLKDAFAKPGNVFLEAVHRLDRPVCGVVLFARTSKALSRLNASIRDRDVRKTYLAVLEGSPSTLEGYLENWVVHRSRHADVVPPDTPGAKRARLSYRVLQRAGDRTLVGVRLITGRYHQIRVQFAAAGCPIAGDELYGSRTTLDDGPIGLVHRELTFTHPVTRKAITVTAPWPEGAPWNAFSPLPGDLQLPDEHARTQRGQHD